MLKSAEIKAKIEALRKINGFQLHSLKIGKPIQDTTFEKIEIESGYKINADLKEFYENFNGVSIEWTISNDKMNLVGSLWILEMEKAFFGAKEIANKNYKIALEDFLWNDEGFAENEIRKLKPHCILESTVGDSSYYTFIPENHDDKLYYIYENGIKKLKFNIQEFIKFRLLTLGLCIDPDKINSKNNFDSLMKIEEVINFSNLHKEPFCM